MERKEHGDEELLETILEEFEEDGRLSMTYIDIEVADGAITIDGRVTSEEELQVIDEVMIDVLEIRDYHNKVWVDDSLTYEDHNEDGPGIKDLAIDSDDIDDQDYSEDEEEEEY